MPVRLVALLLAASTGKSVISGLAFVLAYFVPLYLGYRIGTRKGYSTFQWLLPVLLFSWLGVLFLGLMPRKGLATVQPPAEYHVPPGIDTRHRETRDSALYGKRRT